MSEEEKQAIELLKEDIDYRESDLAEYNSDRKYSNAERILINLINKQQQEIEELTEDKEKVIEIITDTEDDLEKMFIKLISLFKIPKEKIKTNCISKDKIRELINKRNAGIGYTSLECIEDIERLLEE